VDRPDNLKAFRDFIEQLGAKIDDIPTEEKVEPNQPTKSSDIGIEHDRIEYLRKTLNVDANKVIAKINEFNALSIRLQTKWNIRGIYEVLELIDDDAEFERFNTLITGLGNILILFHPEVKARLEEKARRASQGQG
jgi:hypothetical protein